MLHAIPKIVELKGLNGADVEQEIGCKDDPIWRRPCIYWLKPGVHIYLHYFGS